MLNIRKADERGHADHGWLKTWHTFSFAGYHDPRHVHFGPLRVINDDFIAGGGGFPMHPHADMEIITYMLEGALEHRDSMGNGSVIRAGEVQYMCAGTGVRHSEFNHSQIEPARLLQIWILPDRRAYRPDYAQKAFAAADKRGRFCLVASGDGRDGSIAIHQDVDLFAATVDADESLEFDVPAGCMAWVQVARGSLELNGTALARGDGASTAAAGPLRFCGGRGAEILLFSMPNRG